MRSNEIKPGMILEGPVKQLREVLAVTCTPACRRASYRQLSMGNVRARGATLPKVGEVRSISLDYLASWTVREVQA